MRKTIIFILTFMLTMVSVLSAKSAALPTSMIPENAKWVLQLDMQQFLTTQLSDLLKKNYLDKIDNHIQKLAAEYKFNLLNDTTAITVFGTKKGEKDFVVCWSGNFDKSHLLSLLEKSPAYEKFDYGKFTIHKWQHAQFGTFVTDRLVMWSMDETALKNALDLYTGKTRNKAAAPVMSYMKDIPGDAFLRVAAHNIAALANDREASMILRNTGMALFAAMEKNGDLRLTLKMTADTPETAKNIEQIVNGFIALARMKQGGENDPRWKLLDSLKTTLKGNVLQFDFSYPSTELIAMMAEHRKSHGKHMHVHEK